MLGLGSGGVKSSKPSFVSYVTPEEIKPERESSRKEKHPDLLPGEVVFCSATHVLKYTQDDASQRGVYGTLVCTNFKISFVSDETPMEEMPQLFKNKLYGENDIPLTCVDQIYGVNDEKKKLVIGGQVKNKSPSKLVIYCKDLRVFQFCLTYAKEEEAKKIFQGIVHHSLEPKSLKCIFAFSYCEMTAAAPEQSTNQKTIMFESKDEWEMEMKRTKGNCRLATANENYSISEKLPQFFIVPSAVSEEDIVNSHGKGIPIWCWSHHSGCALFKMASLPLPQDDSVAQLHKKYMERVYNAVAQNHLFSLKTEDLSATLPSVQDIQQSYNKFKQYFLIDNITEFWMSDMKWLSSLENSGWLDHIRQCLTKAVEIVECLEKENTNVLMMEEDGSDLSCIITSLVQLMMDPFFRTLSGFQSLVQKEWVAGCHSFLDRCNHLHQRDKESQSPVFLLFLECVWQLLQQHTPAFQFSETYLTVLSDSIHVPLFSTFLFNSLCQKDSAMKFESPEAQRNPLTFPTVWDWSLQFDCKAQDFFTNPLYVEKPKQEKASRKTHRPKHQRQLSLPATPFKSSPRRGFFKEETDSLKKILLGKRITKWIHSPEASALTARDFYQSWQRKPLDYHGLLLPCLDGPAIRVWMQRYLRWIPDLQIFGGGSVSIMTKIWDLVTEIQVLRDELDWCTSNLQFSNQKREVCPKFSARMSSSFPFFSSHNRSFKPVIPTSLLQSMMIGGTLVDKEDEDTEFLGVV
nr:PREDICTED: myotubularin-related protein 12 [Lepisosteus oculatus]